MRIVDSKIINKAGKIEKIPPPQLPEIAFAGRSNVGKSSLLNALVNRKKLFSVGKTPGHTRVITHAEVKMDNGVLVNMVDLPGYGYAKFSKGAKAAWAELIQAYLGNRPTLFLLILLVDIRRGVEKDDEMLIDFLEHARVPISIVATKSDRLKKHMQKPAINKIRKKLQVPVLATSAVTKLGLDELAQMVFKSLGY